MNSIGNKFRISIAGESHSSAITVMIDGVPGGLKLDHDLITTALRQRTPNIKGTTTRKDATIPMILSGIKEDYTTGTPICAVFENNDAHNGYDPFVHGFRPSSADYTQSVKYGCHANLISAGHASGRLTVALVYAGAIAKQVLNHYLPSYTVSTFIDVNQDRLKRAIETGDSVSGLVRATATGIPAGLGEPFFDSVESRIAQLAFSIPAVKQISFGNWMHKPEIFGSEYNDESQLDNWDGGIQGGITNGRPLDCEIWVKPTPSIAKSQIVNGKEMKITGRNDNCIALRVPIILESIINIAILDFYLINVKPIE